MVSLWARDFDFFYRDLNTQYPEYPDNNAKFRVAGAAFGALGATFAWQAQHLVLLEVLLRGRCSTLTVWDVLAGA